MGHNTSRRSVRQKFTVDLVAATAWSTPQRVLLGDSGRLSRCVLRAPASSTVTGVDIMVWQGAHHTTPLAIGAEPSSNVTTPDTEVPDEDRVFYRTGITVAGHATDADDDYNILNQVDGAPFDQRAKDQFVWVSVKTTASTAAQAGASLVLEAVDVE
jgi:hypothetical protein